MLNFFKKRKKKDKTTTGKVIDKLIMGAVIGGAVGSVVGVSMRSKKNEKQVDPPPKKSKSIFKKLFGLLSLKSKKSQDGFKKIPNEEIEKVEK